MDRIPATILERALFIALALVQQFVTMFSFHGRLTYFTPNTEGTIRVASMFRDWAMTGKVDEKE